MAERCPKPGCGAQKRLGNPCMDWDCPQHTVTASDYSTLSARVAQLEEALRVAAAFISEEAEYRGSMDKDYTTPAVPLLQKIQTALSEKEAR